MSQRSEHPRTRDHDGAPCVGERLETGMAGVDTGPAAHPPECFGGVGRPGLGREGGGAGIDGSLADRFLAISVADDHG